MLACNPTALRPDQASAPAKSSLHPSQRSTAPDMNETAMPAQQAGIHAAGCAWKPSLAVCIHHNTTISACVGVDRSSIHQEMGR